ncbi:MAG: hypothetical protein A2095_11690 [Sphingomonadales bacterium GWF1_63_6]|jgi:hypothetical protein|nr:MAG: hypothetical protein A2095_11690 [Sphingomonadales bacterium GWF1_63_6]
MGWPVAVRARQGDWQNVTLEQVFRGIGRRHNSTYRPRAEFDGYPSLGLSNGKGCNDSIAQSLPPVRMIPRDRP